MVEYLSVSKLELDSRLQQRRQLDVTTIAEYAEDMKLGAQFPPIEVIRANGHLWVWDGHHRTRAAKVARIITLAANVQDSTFEQAMWKAAGANKNHGLRRSNEDKRHAVEMALLADPVASDRSIALHCGVHHELVSRIRSDMETTGRIRQCDTRRDASGRMINTTEIGLSQESEMGEPEQDAPPDEQAPQAASDPDPDQMPDGRQSEEAEETEPEEKHPARPTFNRTNDNIQWAAWSWNPVTGCKHDCPYCYARDIANRSYPEKFEPTYHPARLAAPINTKPIAPRWPGDQGHKAVFVCSMADLFGEWVPQEWIDAVLDVVSATPQWTYIFLTKNPKRLPTIEWPENAWVGATVDTLARVLPTQEAFASLGARVCFVSVEPMREPVTFTNYDLFDWVIIGGQSQSSGEPARQPEFWWVHELTDQAHLAGCKVFWKPNLAARPEEYPVSP